MDSIISEIAKAIASQLSVNKPFKQFINEFSEATVKWIKPLFLTEDDTPKEVVLDLQSAPDDMLNIQGIQLVLKKALRDNPALAKEMKSFHTELLQRVKVQPDKNTFTTQDISGNSNIGIQNVSGGSSINIGEKE